MSVSRYHVTLFFFTVVPPAFIFSMLPLLQSNPTFPYLSWYPFEISEKNGRFYVVYAYQAVCVWQMALFNVSIDILIFSLIGVIHYQIRLLSLRVKRLGWIDGKYQIKCKGKFVRNNNFYEEIIECVHLHNDINR